MTQPLVRPDFKILSGFDTAGARHGFFGRRGGVSEGFYSTLNCGPGSNDHPDAVAENRVRVAAVLGARSENILSLYQIHSRKCLRVDAPWTGERPQADALVTDRPGLALSILTADCAPVLLYADVKGKPVIGAAHAGWRGAVAGVLDETVAMMAGEYKVEPSAIRACVGPCIGFDSYEVGRDFFDSVTARDRQAEEFFRPAAKTGHFMFDLARYCAARLRRLGIKNVLVEGSDTYAGEADFFSYRRTTHRREKDYGRQISAILIV